MSLPPKRRGGRRLLFAIVALALAAGGTVAYRVLAFPPAALPVDPTPSYRDLLSGKAAAIRGCLGERPQGFESSGLLVFGDGISSVVARDVERIRELQFASEPSVRFVTEAEMRELLRGGEKRFLTDVFLEEQIVTLLEDVEPSVQLRRLVSEAPPPPGIYLSGRQEVVLIGDEGFIDPDTRDLLAHELAHALVAKSLGFPRSEARSPSDDERRALAALTEGDARLVEFRYATWASSSIERLVEGLAASAESRRGQPASHIFARAYSFPYDVGPSFVCYLVHRNGWKAVDAAFEDPPRTTAQILFPRRYLRGEAAIEPAAPSTPPGPWRLARTRAFGAAELMWLLEAPGGNVAAGVDRALERATGWAGGRLWLWRRGEEFALTLALVQHADGESLCRALTAWHDAAFTGASTDLRRAEVAASPPGGAHEAATVRCADREVRLAVAPDLGMARALVADR